MRGWLAQSVSFGQRIRWGVISQRDAAKGAPPRAIGPDRLRCDSPSNLALLLTGPSKIATLLAPLAGRNLWKGPAAERER